jgi:hypothetical protein
MRQMIIAFALAGIVSAGAANAAQSNATPPSPSTETAMPAASQPFVQNAGSPYLIPVADGCGPAWYRGPGGACHRIGFGPGWNGGVWIGPGWRPAWGGGWVGPGGAWHPGWRGCGWRCRRGW